jgi:uncharacterized protein (TIGR00251 family)
MGETKGRPMKARIRLKVHPRAKRTSLAGRLGEAYKIEVACPPIEGKANQACMTFLAEKLGVPKSAIRIIAGLTSRTKLVEIEGMEQAEAESRLAS